MLQATKALIGLRELILSGELQAGERVREVALVERLTVSRTPIRAALSALADEGLLEKTGGGYAVREFTERDIRDAIEMRGVVEGTAARMAAERGADPAALARARQCLVELDDVLAHAPGDVGRYLELNQRFHELLSGLARSFVVERTLQHVAALPFASANAFVMAESQLGDAWKVFFVAQRQHWALLDAIEAREGTRAEALAREHAHLSLQTLRTVLRTRVAMDRVRGLHLMLLSGAT